MTKEERYKQFTEEMEEAGYKVEEYNGRDFYKGPAVSVDTGELQDVIRATQVTLQWDTLGKDGLIIYPK
jgi:hypothetical protein